jgi:hypothetical protein
MLNYCGYETCEWPKLYDNDIDFVATYQIVDICKQVLDFHLKDRLLCHLGHPYVPSNKCEKLIWEVHYSLVVGHFDVEKIMEIQHKYFYFSKLQQDVNSYIRLCTTFSIVKLAIKRRGLYTRLPTPNNPWESVSMD